MQIDRTDLGQSITKLKLTGKLDINGSSVAEIPIALAAKNSRCVIVDMADVSFVASLGIRHLVMAAKALDRGGGKLVLFAVTDPVSEVMRTMGIVELIPMAATETAALDIAGRAPDPFLIERTGMTPASVHREFLADAAGVAALDDWLESETKAWPFQGAVMKARVCAAEIAANLMEHDAEPARRAHVAVRLSVEADGVALELIDDGRAFDPTRPARPAGETLQEATPGGRGLRTIQGLARRLEYRREGERNHLALSIGA